MQGKGGIANEFLASIDENRAKARLSPNPRTKFFLSGLSIPFVRPLYGYLSRRFDRHYLFFYLPRPLVDLPFNGRVNGNRRRFAVCQLAKIG